MYTHGNNIEYAVVNFAKEYQIDQLQIITDTDFCFGVKLIIDLVDGELPGIDQKGSPGGRESA